MIGFQAEVTGYAGGPGRLEMFSGEDVAPGLFAWAIPNGETHPVNRRIFSRDSSYLLPGSTIVIPRHPRPFDWLVMTQSITPILANLATSAAAIAALND